MKPLPPQKLLLLYECLGEISEILEFSREDVINCFFCGVSSKWGLPNTLLVVIKNNCTNRFQNEMNTIDGCGGSAYVDKLVSKRAGVWDSANRKYQFRYRVMFESIFNGASSYNVIFDHEWVNDNDPYRGGLPILEDMQRLDELAAFI